MASAGPLNEHVDSARAVVDAGAAAIVLPSLFEEEVLHEQVELHDALEAGPTTFAEALDYFPDFAGLLTVADRYVRSLEAAQGRSRRAGDRPPQRRLTPGSGSPTPPVWSTPAPTPSS